MPRDSDAPDVFQQGPDTSVLIEEIRRDKYMQPGEKTWQDLHYRVARGLFGEDERSVTALVEELGTGRACPAGRVLAGSGTSKNVTWWNCFVAPLLQDSMRTNPEYPGLGIMDTLTSVAYSMQMGGGVGTDFSPLRPSGALVERVGAPASGPLPFMDMWDSMCRTIMSAGYRRGAMMSTMRCDHPDLMAFISAKHDGARLRMFNVSVLVTDAFMTAVANDESWELGHWVRPFDSARLVAMVERFDRACGSMRPWYVYEKLPARHIWDVLMKSTYVHAEPGVIFIDRANLMNNLYYAEYLQCSNPCGEQIMAPDDNCNLSHVNLSRCTTGELFTNQCLPDFDSIVRVTRLMVRMSDRVIDLSPVPTEAQRVQAQAKRRLGIGITGLANALMFMRQRYGSPEALDTTQQMMEHVRNASYSESIELAKEHGPFPLFDRDKYLAGEFIKTLPEYIRDGIADHGIRNALLNTVAPTGTVSIAQAGNASAGLEPVFAARYVRKVLQPDGSYKESVIEDLGFRAYANVLHGGDMNSALVSAGMTDYMVTTADITPTDHLLTQARVQACVDNSVSKTINVPTSTSFDDFSGIYTLAYSLGCKGCTTYRPDPSSGRGSVLSEIDEPGVVDAPNQDVVQTAHALRPRPDVLEGCTYRLRWGTLPYPMFLTVNDELRPDGRRVPFEVFLNSKSVDYTHWVTALTRVITAVMRKGGDLSFLPDELKSVWSARGGEFIDQQFVPSEVALIGLKLEDHFRRIGYSDAVPAPAASDAEVRMTGAHYAELGIGEQCPTCGALQVVREEGCKRCMACGWSNCN